MLVRSTPSLPKLEIVYFFQIVATVHHLIKNEDPNNKHNDHEHKADYSRPNGVETCILTSALSSFNIALIVSRTNACRIHNSSYS